MASWPEDRASYSGIWPALLLHARLGEVRLTQTKIVANFLIDDLLHLVS